MDSMSLQQNVDLFLSVTAASAVPTVERDALISFLSNNQNGNKYAIYKGEQSYFFEDDKLVNCRNNVILKNAALAYRFDGLSFDIQELPEGLVFSGGGSDPKKRRDNGGSYSNNNNNNNNNG